MLFKNYKLFKVSFPHIDNNPPSKTQPLNNYSEIIYYYYYYY